MHCHGRIQLALELGYCLFQISSEYFRLLRLHVHAHSYLFGSTVLGRPN
jgi:hypothetical protein